MSLILILRKTVLAHTLDLEFLKNLGMILRRTDLSTILYILLSDSNPLHRKDQTLGGFFKQILKS